MKLFHVVLAIACFACCSPMAQGTPNAASVPLIIIHNRAYVEVQLERRDRSMRPARFWVDNGNPELAISEPLARDLGLDLSKTGKNEDGMAVAAVELPRLLIGGLQIQTEAVSANVLLGNVHVFAEKDVDGILPSTILKHYQVRFDYPGRRFTIGDPGALKPRGIRIACTVHPSTGMVLMTAKIAGKSYDMTLDMGSAFTLVSESLAQQWATQHSDWPQLSGAIGAANMLGAPYEAASPMMRVPSLELGSGKVQNAAVASMPKNFFDWYSQKTSRPAVGAIGGNVLKSFRFLIDYPASAVYLERQIQPPQHEFDLVGLVLAPSRDRDGYFAIRSIARQHGKPVLECLQTGDKVLKIDGVDTQGKTLAEVIDALRGEPGSHRSLLLERKGAQLTFNAAVVRLL